MNFNIVLPLFFIFMGAYCYAGNMTEAEREAILSQRNFFEQEEEQQGYYY